ncbi:probable trehalose-phosphate phosphatase D [Ricinus communis]|uniref:Trehalose 6-phosphate phosphatase n=1 Tax=Ricinus communis TaxID=3988 RepID=B9RJH8_RICCO|nr:probable trehalose-phosphate phosphatase D [Ricinus communis]EEF48480.1 trehalose-6-phosphate synthase, putative [Ricinus communis]|eukprot:XP_002513897.1 probable trehalose-phosphate phosphatase D [Ricinus communis]
MTNQNVVSTEAKLRIDIRIRVLLPKSLFSPAVVPKPLLLPAPKLANKMETRVTGVRTSTWVDSMRDSSPTRVKSTASLSEIEEKSSWIVNHPSALSVFEQIVNASKGKQIVMFLDYDGTLSPIVEDPDRAFMTNEMRDAVRDVARYFPTAIVTGRCRDKVYSFVKLAGLYYAGSHGMDIKGPSKSHKYRKDHQSVLFQPASKFLPMIDEVYKVLMEKTKSIPGAKVENNKFCLSVHFRCVEEQMWAALAEEVRSVLNDYPKLRLTQGRKVLEIRPTIKWDKGKALEFLLESLGYANSTDVLPVYIGDDRSDEDAFKVLRNRGQGLGILVSKFPKETNASYSLQDPAEVKDFLRRLVEWKQKSLRGLCWE